MIMLTLQFQRMLKQQLEEKPLSDGEMRRVEGMGELYVSTRKEPPTEYYFKYSLDINGTPYYFFGKNE